MHNTCERFATYFTFATYTAAVVSDGVFLRPSKASAGYSYIIIMSERFEKAL